MTTYVVVLHKSEIPDRAGLWLQTLDGHPGHTRSSRTGCPSNVCDQMTVRDDFPDLCNAATYVLRKLWQPMGRRSRRDRLVADERIAKAMGEEKNNRLHPPPRGEPYPPE